MSNLTPEFLQYSRRNNEHGQRIVSDETIAEFYGGKNPSFLQKLNSAKKKNIRFVDDDGRDISLSTALLNYEAFGDYRGLGLEEKEKMMSMSDLSGKNEDEGFFSYLKNIGKGLVEDVQKAASGVNEALTAAHGGIRDYRGPGLKEVMGDPNRSFLQSILPVTGELAFGATEALTEPVKPIIENVGELFSILHQRAVERGDAKLTPDQEKDLTAFREGVVNAFTDLKTKHPAIAENLEGALKTISLPLALQGAESTLKTGEKLVTGIGEKTVEGARKIAELRAKKSLSELEEFVQPKIGRKELDVASRQGRVETTRSGKPIRVKPSKTDSESASVLSGIEGVNTKNIPKTMEVLQNEIPKRGNLVRSEISQRNFAFSDKELVGRIARARLDAVENATVTTAAEVKTWQQVEKLFFKKFQAALKAQKGPKNRLLATYDARIAMDAIAPKPTFAPDLVQTAKAEAFRSIRNSANEFLSESLARQGAQYAEQMREMHLIFRAMDNLSTKLPTRLQPTLGAKAIEVTKRKVLKPLAIGAGAAAGGIVASEVLR